MIKKSACIILSILLMSSLLLAGCNSQKNALVEGKINVITSFYPLYDFASKIGGEHVNVINLVPAGVDSHDWEPKTQDIANITNADLLLYNGLGFEGWIDNVLKNLSSDSNLVSIETSEGIETISSEEEGHEEEGHEEEGHEEEGHEEEGHEEEEHEEEGHEDEHEHEGLDPHVWLSPLQAITIAENIKNAIIKVDPANKQDYEANYEKLNKQLVSLHEKFEHVISNSSRKDIVVSHQAYGYLARDYHINQVALMGISPEAEPTPQDLKEIINYVTDHDVKYILFEELVSPKLAKSLAADANIETLVFNPLEGLTEQQLKDNEDYISIMGRNLTSLEKALQ